MALAAWKYPSEDPKALKRPKNRKGRFLIPKILPQKVFDNLDPRPYACGSKPELALLVILTLLLYSIFKVFEMFGPPGAEC